MSTVHQPLKYHFTAEHLDGTVVKQNLEDSSKSGEGSALRDIDVNNLLAFHLQSERDTVSVNLQTGQFRINGFVFSLAPQNFIKKHPFKLVFWRSVKKTMTITGEIQEDMSVKTFERDGIPFVCDFIVGWETIDSNGKKLQRTVIFK